MHTEPIESTAAGLARVQEALAGALAGGAPVLPLPPERERAAVLRQIAATGDGDPGVALLVPTSGSTATPKLVELTAAALTASAHGTAAALGGTAQWLLALPMTHIAGLQVVVRSLLAGTDPVVHDAPSFSAESFVAATARLTGARRHTALVPTQLRRLLTDEAATSALASYDAVLVGGAAASPSLLTAARAAGVAVVTTYGMTETAGGCVYDGAPLAGTDVRLDDAGRILLGGPTVARGYRGDPVLTAAAFAGGRFHTADLGRVDDRGRLLVLGRADDVVITGGVNVHPLAVEALLARLPGVRDVCVAGVPDPEWGAVVTAWVVGDAEPSALREAVRAELGPAAAPRAVHRIEAIPLTVSGKPDRRRLVAGVVRRTD